MWTWGETRKEKEYLLDELSPRIENCTDLVAVFQKQKEEDANYETLLSAHDLLILNKLQLEDTACRSAQSPHGVAQCSVGLQVRVQGAVSLAWCLDQAQGALIQQVPGSHCERNQTNSRLKFNKIPSFSPPVSLSVMQGWNQGKNIVHYIFDCILLVLIRFWKWMSEYTCVACTGHL